MSQASKHGGVPLLFIGIFLAWLSLPAQAQTRPAALSVAQVKSLIGEWQGSDRDLDREAIRHLAQARKDAEIQVFFGTECPDSRREVPRLLRILSDLGPAPFSVKFFQVDKDKREPAKLLAANDIVFLPTFVVTLRGKEVGRIVERSPRPLETDLTLLLEGKKDGLISASEQVIWHYLNSADPSKKNSG